MGLQKRFQHFFASAACGLASLAMPAQSVLADEPVDATDPTKIYSYLGAGLKYTEYTNGEFMWELRATGNIGLTESDMLLFEGAMVNTMVIRPRVATPAERAFEFAGFICSIWIMSLSEAIAAGEPRSMYSLQAV